MRGVRWKRGEGSSAGHTVSTRPNQTQNLSMIGDGATLPSGRALRSPVSHRPEPPFTQAHAASQTGQRVSLGRAAARPVEPASDQRRPARSTGARVPARPHISKFRVPATPFDQTISYLLVHARARGFPPTLGTPTCLASSLPVPAPLIYSRTYRP